MSRFDHFVGRPMRPGPEYVGTRSEMRSHSSSVKSPCADRQVFEMDPAAAPSCRVYANSDPESTELATHTATIFLDSL
jgi:hypothetical protein